MLFRRFSIVVSTITLLGVLLANAVQSARYERGTSQTGLKIHNRTLDWQKRPCGTITCGLVRNGSILINGSQLG
ncbi:MAG: hypothetical protein AAF468_15935 [Pseudomonadota bacterium]